MSSILIILLSIYVFSLIGDIEDLENEKQGLIYKNANLDWKIRELEYKKGK